jgi:bifunctional oligoribonuclease and PAP phosphatase NrnA
VSLPITAAELAARLPHETDVLLIAHENPDGDALGCVVAMMLVCARLGVPHRAYIPGEGPFPAEYGFLPRLDEIARGAFPPATDATTAIMMDCATPGRIDPTGLQCVGTCVDVDHHQDNVGFGTLNLLDFSAASSTQIVYDVLVAGGIALDAEIATALYCGLLTDTGRFQYSNTTPAAHRMAAVLQEAGVKVDVVYRHVYENTPLPKILLLERALGRLELLLDGQVAVAWLDRDDFAAVGAAESHTEGIIDTLRTIAGVRMAVLLREQSSDDGPVHKGSLRSTDDAINVAVIAHLWDGGGHVRAAGFTAHESRAAIIARLLTEADAQL